MLGRIKAHIITALLAARTSLASVFNRNVTAPHVAAAPIAAPRRKKGFQTGIKGVASSNNTQYGYGLREHFAKARMTAIKAKARRTAALATQAEAA